MSNKKIKYQRNIEKNTAEQWLASLSKKLEKSLIDCNEKKSNYFLKNSGVPEWDTLPDYIDWMDVFSMLNTWFYNPNTLPNTKAWWCIVPVEPDLRCHSELPYVILNVKLSFAINNILSKQDLSESNSFVTYSAGVTIDNSPDIDSSLGVHASKNFPDDFVWVEEIIKTIAGTQHPLAKSDFDTVLTRYGLRIEHN